MTTSTTQTPLGNLRGTILLVGAGKMGSALLEGWLALGLEPKSIAVIEPQPTPEIDGAGGARPAPQSVAVARSARSPPWWWR